MKTASASLLAACAAIGLSSCGSPAATAGTKATAVAHCPAMRKLAKPESLNQLYRRTGIPPAITLYFVERCDWYHGGWTSNVADLLNGAYGPNPLTARLPRGTRLWLPGGLP